MLKRELGYYDLLFISVGSIIGGGIFSLMGRSIKYGGGITWIYLVLTGLIMLFMSRAYTDLMDKLKDNETEYTIAQDFGGKKFAPIYTICSTIASASTGAVIGLAFAEHIKHLFNLNISTNIISIITLIIISIINMVGIRQSTNVINSMTAIEASSLLLLIGFLPFKFNIKELSKVPNIPKSILVPLIIIFAFTGAENLPKLAGESKNPKQDIPKAINTSLVITTGMYALVCMVMISVLGVNGASNSITPMLDAYKKIFGNKVSSGITIVALFSIFNTIMSSNISSSRTLYGLGLKKQIPYLNYVNKKTKTPITAIIIGTVMSIGIMFSINSIERLAIFSNLFIMITMIVINGAAYKENKGEKNKWKRYRNIGSIALAVLFIGFGSRELIK